MTDLDRRKFLQRSGVAAGGLLASPRAGLIAAVAGVLATSGEASGAEDAAAQGGRKPRRLLRSGEPLNARGEPFGHSVSGVALAAAPAADPASRVLLVAGHGAARPGCEERIARRTLGISVVELIREAGVWRHEVASHHNRRWHLDTPVAFDGARLVPDKPLFRLQRQGEGVGEIACVVGTPWNTVLCAERGGWIVEVNPVSGTAIRRLSIGRVDARELRVEARPGQPVELELTGAGGQAFKFVSHQRFDPRALQASSQLLLIGELAADGKPVTEGLVGEEWARSLENPAPTSGADCNAAAPAAAATETLAVGSFSIASLPDGASVVMSDMILR